MITLCLFFPTITSYVLVVCTSQPLARNTITCESLCGTAAKMYVGERSSSAAGCCLLRRQQSQAAVLILGARESTIRNYSSGAKRSARSAGNFFTAGSALKSTTLHRSSLGVVLYFSHSSTVGTDMKYSACPFLPTKLTLKSTFGL